MHLKVMRGGAVPAMTPFALPPESFFTRRGGMAQVLPNGNLLVAQSDAGRLFEITGDGEIAWDFWNPVFAQNREGQEPQHRAPTTDRERGGLAMALRSREDMPGQDRKGPSPARMPQGLVTLSLRRRCRPGPWRGARPDCTAPIPDWNPTAMLL